MKAMRVEYDEATDNIEIQTASVAEDWLAVCTRYHDDVHRLRGVSDQGNFTALFECFDDDDNKIHYLVEEDARLKRHRRRTFLRKLGQEGA